MYIYMYIYRSLHVVCKQLASDRKVEKYRKRGRESVRARERMLFLSHSRFAENQHCTVLYIPCLAA